MGISPASEEEAQIHDDQNTPGGAGNGDPFSKLC